MIDVCPKCSGSGIRPRTKDEDGAEADPELHNCIAAAPKLCERCGGGGKIKITPGAAPALVAYHGTVPLVVANGGTDSTDATTLTAHGVLIGEAKA